MSLVAISIAEKSEFTGWKDEPCVSFENDSVYDTLAPYFNSYTPTATLDPYDGGKLKTDCIPGFICLLVKAREVVLNQEETWTVRTESWIQGNQTYSRDIVAQKSQVLRVIENLTKLAESASSRKNQLIFIGD